MTSEKAMDRRSLLRRTSAVLSGSMGFPHLIPSTALGKKGDIAPSNRITMAVIGCGGMGRSNLRAFLNMPDVRVTAICDVDRIHLKETKQSNGIRRGRCSPMTKMQIAICRVLSVVPGIYKVSTLMIDGMVMRPGRLIHLPTGNEFGQDAKRCKSR